MKVAIERVGACVTPVGLEQYRTELLADSLSERQVADELSQIDPNLPDFYFTLFADLATGERIDTGGVGRWYVGCFYPELVQDREAGLIEAVRTEMRGESPEERWSMLLVALTEAGLDVTVDALEAAQLVVELDPSAKRYVRGT